jgi:hypothetical protein
MRSSSNYTIPPHVRQTRPRKSGLDRSTSSVSYRLERGSARSSGPAGLERLRSLQMLLERRQRLLGELARLIVLLRFLLEFADVLLMVGDHHPGELAVKTRSGNLGHAVILRLLLRLRLIWRGDADIFGHRHGLLIGVRMVPLQHLAEGAHPFAVAVLLRKLAHLDFSQVAFNRVLDKRLARFVLRPRSRGAQYDRGCKAGPD